MKIVYVVIDTLRADHLGCYGYKRDTSPTIDKLAKEGVLFLNAYPSDVPTQPSYTAMFTGKRGISTGVVSHSETEKLSRDEVFYPELLAKNGYRTGAISTLYNMKRYFARGFQSYLNPAAESAALIQRVTAEKINEMAIPWLRQNYKEDFFLFLHYWDPHTVYLPPKQYRNLFYKGKKDDPNLEIKDDARYPFTVRLLKQMGGNITDIEYVIAQYDAEIRYVDDELGKLIALLKELGIFEETLIILTSDHGESFGEHGIYFDHASVYEDTAHVPLIFKHPSFPRGKKIEGLVQLIDIAPSIFEFSNLKPIESFAGRSLFPLISGKTDKHYDEIYTNQGTHQAVRMIRAKEHKLIKYIDRAFWPGAMTELFNLKEDPKELKNLADEKKEIRDALELKLKRWEEKELGLRADPLRVIAEKGLPTKKWLKQLMADDKGDYDEWRRKMGW